MVLSDYITIMKPIATALDLLQGDKNASLGYLLPSIYTIKKRLKDAMFNTVPGENMQATVLAAIEARFEKQMKLNGPNKPLFIAAVSHPLFKLDWVPEYDRETVRTWFFEAVQRLSPESIVEQNDSENQFDSDFFHRYTQSDIGLSINSEIENFLNFPKRCVSVLNDFPTIKKLFIESNTTLPSSASVERIFSQAGLIFQPRRNRLSEANFERTLFLKVNS